MLEASHEILSADKETIASAVYLELNRLDVEELWDRSGSTRHGYVEPNEMASEMIPSFLRLANCPIEFRDPNHIP